MTSKIDHYWARFCEASHVDTSTPYQVWYFGNTREMAAELAALVLAGRKTATASLVEVNKLRPSEAPVVGGYSVVTDFDGDPVCVVQTVDIREVAFEDVDPGFAAQEGEGDLSLEYWRRVHEDYFVRETRELGLNFDARSLVCCERFRLLYSG